MVEQTLEPEPRYCPLLMDLVMLLLVVVVMVMPMLMLVCTTSRHHG